MSTPSRPACDCKGAGYCARHKVNKSRTLYELCKTNKVYFDAWERGEGPGQKIKQVNGYDSQYPWRYVTTAAMIDAAIAMIPKIGVNIARVAGIPRSGMMPASVLATMLHVPLYEVSQQYGMRRVGNGWRGDQIDEHDGTTLIVDDTVYNGYASHSVRQLVPNHIFAAVYVRPTRERLVDVYGEILPSPHLLEWNLFNSGMTSGKVMNPNFRGGIATDLDGVLCEDCPPAFDGDDTPEGDERYRQWILHAKPKLVVDFFPVPLIVTYRPKRFRAETEEWLAKNRIKYDNLVMHPAAKFKDRNFDSPEFKGKEYTASGCSLFVESDDTQAKLIHEYTGLPVLSLCTKEVYQNMRHCREPINSHIGDIIARRFSSLGIKPIPGCKCKDTQAKLNSMTPQAVESDLNGWAFRLQRNAKQWQELKGGFWAMMPTPPLWLCRRVLEDAVREAKGLIDATVLTSKDETVNAV